MREDITCCCTDGTPYSYLGGAFFHRHHHNVAHANGPCQQRTNAHQPCQEVNPVKQIIHHTEERLHIKGGQCLFVGRIYMVCTRHHRTYLGCNFAHFITLMGCKTQQVNGVAHGECIAHHVYRYNNRLLCTTVNVDLTRTIIHPHNLKEHRSNANILATRISALREKGLIHLLSNDAHLTFLKVIDVVKITSVIDVGRFDALIALF